MLDVTGSCFWCLPLLSWNLLVRLGARLIYVEKQRNWFGIGTGSETGDGTALVEKGCA